MSTCDRFADAVFVAGPATFGVVIRMLVLCLYIPPTFAQRLLGM